MREINVLRNFHLCNKVYANYPKSRYPVARAHAIISDLLEFAFLGRWLTRGSTVVVLWANWLNLVAYWCIFFLQLLHSSATSVPARQAWAIVNPIKRKQNVAQGKTDVVRRHSNIKSLAWRLKRTGKAVEPKQSATLAVRRSRPARKSKEQLASSTAAVGTCVTVVQRQWSASS